eukprot:TRINITY_DN122170_c0_g1_i1.p1 TRINITY_DN122170_c0_g1~~TRINITY_DN122170_c0_g1_i1.p1  ORF type:complete len:816 (+),score=165.74 TRINITY_DN122170_c0_g1_i1:102-2549(+)
MSCSSSPTPAASSGVNPTASLLPPASKAERSPMSPVRAAPPPRLQCSFDDPLSSQGSQANLARAPMTRSGYAKQEELRRAAHLSAVVSPSSTSPGLRALPGASRSQSRLCREVIDGVETSDDQELARDRVHSGPFAGKYEDEPDEDEALPDDSLVLRLGPPLSFLPKDINPRELQEFRASYQAFRAGQAAGARGEIEWLLEELEDEDEYPNTRTSSDKNSKHMDHLPEDAAYYSEPERDVGSDLFQVASSPKDTDSLPPRSPPMAFTLPPLRSPILGPTGQLPSPADRLLVLESAAATAAPSSTATSRWSPPMGPARPASRPISPGLRPTVPPSIDGMGGQLEATGSLLPPTTGGSCSSTSPVPAEKTPKPVLVAGTAVRLDFSSWLGDEVRSRPDEEQLKKVPRSHLKEVCKVPKPLEKILGFGFLLCLDILLHELSFTLTQVARALPRLICQGSCRALSVTEQCDVLRCALLLANVVLVGIFIDPSYVYHYIRGESFLKLYVIFNMLEMFERWFRSIGVDLFDMLMSSVRHPWRSLLPKFFATLAYCFVHSTMHLLRVLLLNVAINTSSSQVFLIIVTNNFGEIKSTVFKKYEAKSLFPIVTSDIVERFYLVLDIVFVLARLGVSPHRGMGAYVDIVRCLFLLVALEVVTDWIKFCLIVKFSEMKVNTLDVYKEVLIADILLCRARKLPKAYEAEKVATSSGGKDGTSRSSDSAPAMPLRGIHSFSHVPARRVGFSGVPLSTLVVLHFVMLARSPCVTNFVQPWATGAVLLFAAFVLCLLAKVLLSASLLGYAASRRKTISHNPELFSKIKAL